MNRIERISAILIQLQSKRNVTAQSIANRFGISLRTVYRDIRALETSGVPIIGEPGYGYSLTEGYKLPPVHFTLDEATAFLTAEKLIEHLTDRSVDEGYKSAMYKIRAVMRTSEKNYLEALDENIAVIKNPYLPGEASKTNYLQLVINAIANKHVLRLNYFANHDQRATERDIEPVGVFYQGGRWYLIAWCNLRKDYRNFRLDRIQQLKSLLTNFNKEHPSLKKYLKQVSKDEKLISVVLKFDNEALRYIGEQKYYHGFVSEKKVGACTEMKFLTGSLEGIMRWYLMMADHTEIVSPKELKHRVFEFTTAIAAKNKF